MITNLTLFLTSKCNLNCKYCYIHKDQNFLNQIENKIIEIQSNKYFDQIADYESNIKYNIKSITLWGGEPFLEFDQILYLLNSYIKYFPNLKKFFISTNFTLDNETEQLLYFIHFLQRYKRKFTIDLQISIDGYTEMNDFCKGKGVTEKFIQNYKKIKNLKLKYDHDLIILNIFTKSTLDKNNLDFLTDKKDCELWFNFFKELNISNPLWNFAEPYIKYDQTDGIKYSQICQNVIDLGKIIPEVHFIKKQNNCIDCGIIPHNLTVIGDDQYTVCHRGWFDQKEKQLIFNKEELKELQTNILCSRETIEYNIKNTMIQYIKQAAIANEIESKYLDENNIKSTLDLFLKQKYCPLNNYLNTGYWNIPSDNLVRLYYNGAIDFIIQQLNLRRKINGLA